jgi:4-amino-4-deoxy-L-arabinose transferase-like glycosyltransferase
MKRFYPYFIIASAGAVLFFHSLGKVPLFDWDEINFAESAREMISSGNYLRVQINYEPFWEKPPFFFWLQSVAMHLFGVGEFAARLPNAICGIVTLLVLYSVGRRLHNERMARWWTLIYAAAFLPHLYFKSGIIDPWFNLFIFISIYFLSRLMDAQASGKKRILFLYLSALFAGLGIITKGPVALLVVLLTYLVFLIIYRKTLKIYWTDYIQWGLAAAFVSTLWFGLEIIQNGWWFLEEFITYQIRLAKTEDAGHGGFLLYHFVVVFIGCFPASILMWGGQKEPDRPLQQQYFRTMMIASLGVILVVFTLVKTKIVHYSSFAYLPVGYLAAAQIDALLSGKAHLKKWQTGLILGLGVLWSVIFIALPLIGQHPEWIRPLLEKDPFAAANLKAQVEWGSWLIIPGFIFLGAIICVFVLLRKKQIRQGLLLLLMACIMAMQVLLSLFAPRIEQYSQHAAIEFFRSIRGQSAYVGTYGYKSYAHYFYAEVGKESGVIAKPADWILSTATDKPAYLVSKITEKENLLNYYPSLKVLYEKNGFVFYIKSLQR